MSNISRMGLLAFVLGAVACGGTAETSSPTDPLGSESMAIVNDPACPRRPPVLGTGCVREHLTCFYHTTACPPGDLTAFECVQNDVGNLAWSENTKCAAGH